MFGRRVVVDMINRSAENEADRRVFLKKAGLAGLGTAGTVAAMGLGASTAEAVGSVPSKAPSDGAVLNFALNLEYLEAEFYHYAVYGEGIKESLTRGTGRWGSVTGGHKVPFKNDKMYQMAKEIASDERQHVEFLRKNLGSAAVARPSIDLRNSFTAAAMAAGLIKKGQTFDPFANEVNFLLGAFIFEDVGVTAYKGASPLIDNKTYLEAAAGILAVEAYHAGAIRYALASLDLVAPVGAISNARDSLDGKSDLDQGITRSKKVNLTPTDSMGIAFSRSPGQVLNVVYLTNKQATKGGFFPHGVNGSVNESADNA